MIDSKSNDDKSKEADIRVASKSSDATMTVYEIGDENYTRIIEEIIKNQSQYSLAISNFQSDYIQTIKNVIEASFQAQKHLVGTNTFNWSNTPLATLYLEQSEALTYNIIRTLATNTKLAINALEAARNSFETSSNVVKAVTEVNTNVVTSWNSFVSNQQQHLFK